MKSHLIKQTLLLLFIISSLQANSNKTTLTFAPLPLKKKSKTIEEFIPLFNYIDKAMEVKTKFFYEQDYAEILNKFTEGKIDLALLGPLPYAKLNEIYKFNKPLITFKQKNGDAYYRCVLSKFGRDNIDFNKKLNVALTQPLSTCGYYMTNIMLKNKYNKDLRKQSFQYTNSHSNALIGVLEGDFDIAGVKDSIAKGFSTLGMKVLEKSTKLPGFTLVVNTKTVSTDQIKKIQDTILSIPLSNYKKWNGISSNGFIKSDKEMYDKLNVDFKSIPMVGNINEK